MAWRSACSSARRSRARSSRPLIGRHSPLLPFVLPVLRDLLPERPRAGVADRAGQPGACARSSSRRTFAGATRSAGWPTSRSSCSVCAALIEILHRLQVTHRKLLDSEALLLEADRRKNEFLAMLAHELRNPLAPIRNSAPILSQRAPTSRRRPADARRPGAAGLASRAAGRRPAGRCAHHARQDRAASAQPVDLRTSSARGRGAAADDRRARPPLTVELAESR